MKLRVPGKVTGAYGPVEFVDGVSVRTVSYREANLIRSSIRGVEIVEDDGVTIDEALNSLSQIYPLHHYTENGLEPPSRFLTQWDGSYPVAHVEPVVTETVKDTVVENKEPEVKKWKLEELCAIADAKGIDGLREIANPLKVKGRSIKTLIEAMKAAGYVEVTATSTEEVTTQDTPSE